MKKIQIINRHGNAGFTLIEVMIVVAVVAILAAIAYPSYESSVRKTYRGTAKSCLLEHAAAMERFYSSNMFYQAPATPLGCTIENNLNSRYTITVAVPAPQEFTLTATPVGPQVKDTVCMNLSVNQTGQRAASADPGNTNRCW